MRFGESLRDALHRAPWWQWILGLLALALTLGLVRVGFEIGWDAAGITAASLAGVGLLVWGLLRHPRGTLVVLTTVCTVGSILLVSSSAWGAVNPGLSVFTPVLFTLAAPAGAWWVPASNDSGRWLTVVVVDAGLLMVAAAGPVLPTLSTVLAVVALGVPLVVQGWVARGRRITVVAK